MSSSLLIYTVILENVVSEEKDLAIEEHSDYGQWYIFLHEFEKKEKDIQYN